MDQYLHSTFCSCSSSNQRALLAHFLLYSVYNINIVRIALIKINKMTFFLDSIDLCIKMHI